MRMMRRKKKSRSPDFVGIGTMKSGTTWTWQQMRKHPDIGTPKNRNGKLIKEFHFFDRVTMSVKDYKRLFGTLDHHTVGEFTPNYFSCPHAPAMIKTLFPNVKLFVLLRNPVERAFSHYKDHLWLGKVKQHTPFIEAFMDDHSKVDGPHYTIKAKGMYGDLLERWKQHFDDTQLKVFFYDDMVSNPLRFLKAVFRWVGADPSFVPPDYDEKVLKKYNKAYDDLKMEPQDRKRVAAFYAPQVSKLSELTGRELSWS